MQVAVWVILFASVFPQRKTQHRRGEQEGEENKTMFIFDRRLGAAVAEGSNQGVQPEGMGLWKGQPGGGGNTGICHYCDCQNQQHLRQETGWSFNKVYFVIFKAYCFEQGCKSRFG